MPDKRSEYTIKVQASKLGLYLLDGSSQGQTHRKFKYTFEEFQFKRSTTEYECKIRKEVKPRTGLTEEST